MRNLKLIKNICAKSYSSILFCLTIFLLLTSCGEDNSSQEEPLLTPPALVSSNPIDGAIDIPDDNLTAVLTYDQNVTAPSSGHSKVTAGEAVVSDVSANLKNLTIKLTGLVKGKTYTLTVPKSVVLGPTKVEAPQVSITFTIIKEPDIGPITGTLCTVNPLPQAKKVYDYLVSVYGKKTLSGSMANVSWNIAEAELVKQATGKYPAIAFFDYIHLGWSPANWIDYSDIKVLQDWWNANGLVGIGWHWNVPNVEGGEISNYTCTPGNGTKNTDGYWTTTFRAKNVFIEGTWESRVAKADLEKISNYLKLLQDKGIPVIWRPLHEAAGNIYEYNGGTAWFWWGYDGAETYKKLWIYMFDFFKSKGINNLIWVWTTQTKDAAFYPGDAYVDIIGRDIYNQPTAIYNAAQYNTILASYSNKLIALSECGSVANVSTQWTAGARWSFFMPWYQYNATTLVGHQYADKTWWTDAMNLDFVLSRSDLPSLK